MIFEAGLRRVRTNLLYPAGQHAGKNISNPRHQAIAAIITNRGSAAEAKANVGMRAYNLILVLESEDMKKGRLSLFTPGPDWVRACAEKETNPDAATRKRTASGLRWTVGIGLWPIHAYIS